MLYAKKIGFWKGRYEITDDGRDLATWEPSVWKKGGTVELDGRRHEIRGTLWGSSYEMVTADGTAVAAANRVGRKSWTVDAGGRIFEFQRASIWRHEQLLLSDGRQIGSVRRASMWSRDATADLPGLPVPVQLFVLAVVLTMWAQQAASAGAGAAATG